MDPPPPYEAGSSRSSSAHSNDRLQGGGPSQSRSDPQGDNAPELRTDFQQEERPETRSETTKAKPEDGCCTFGRGATGCMVYGDHAQGKGSFQLRLR